MKIYSLSLTTLILLGAASCSSTPKLVTVNGALVAQAPESSLIAVDEARRLRDDAEDNLDSADAKVINSEERSQISRAELYSTRSQVEQSRIGVQIAKKSGTPADLEKAEAAHMLTLANADVARDNLAVAKRQLELDKVIQKKSKELLRLANAEVEYSKALAVQDVNLVAAKEVPVRDFKRQVRYHEREVEVATERVEDAEKRLAEDTRTLDDSKAKRDTLMTSGN